jgi:hypothetical protein
MSIALARAYPRLRACILDFNVVCDAAKKIIRKERMSHRIKTIAGDMNKSIPGGFDVIMFWDIGHIDTYVMKMAYESLTRGGMIVLSYPPSSKPNTPSPGRFFHEYISVRPRMQTRPSKMNSLKTAGFRSVKYRSIGRELGMITGRKK